MNEELEAASTCPHCAEPVNTAAKVCPHCGRRFANYNERGRWIGPRWLPILAVLAGAVLVLWMLTSANDSAKDQSRDQLCELQIDNNMPPDAC